MMEVEVRLLVEDWDAERVRAAEELDVRREEAVTLEALDVGLAGEVDARPVEAEQ